MYILPRAPVSGMALLSNVTGDYMTLPNSVQEIADVIGREAALYLIGQLPRCYPPSRKSQAVVMYVPKRLTTDHPLFRILGWTPAQKLVAEFGGEILYPANCNEIYRRFRDSEVRRLANENGMTAADLSEIMGVSARHIQNLMRATGPVAAGANDNSEIPQEDRL